MIEVSYNSGSSSSIIEYAKQLIGKSLLDACGDEIMEYTYGGKGNFGQLLEKFYFGYEPNSLAEPDFLEVNLELKASPLKYLKNGEIRAKERLVLNIINYMNVHQEEFYESSFWKKNSHLLLVFYLYGEDVKVLNYVIKLVDEWKYPDADLTIIKRDWQFIQDKIKAGKAHELSEGDTFYLGACTKGSTAEKSYREQPFNTEKAKQRAYSLKQGYVNHIIASIAGVRKVKYGKILHSDNIKSKKTLEEIVVDKFAPFYGQTPREIQTKIGEELNVNAKSYFASLTKLILGIGKNEEIEEFQKGNIQVKTVRLKENGLPKEHISFPAFKYEELVQTDWEDSNFKSILEQKFFFVFYQFKGSELHLKKVKFWNMSNSDLNEVCKVFNETKRIVKGGNIVNNVTAKGIRRTNLPGKNFNRISHVRPHATNKMDTYSLPNKDKVTGLAEYTKHSFWLNDNYIRDDIYNK
ncbi:MAG: DNA mismatch repair protein MutH [Flavobacteriales bacterium]